MMRRRKSFQTQLFSHESYLAWITSGMKETEAKIDKNNFSISSSHILDHILQDGKLANNNKTKKFNDQHPPLVMFWRTKNVKNS